MNTHADKTQENKSRSVANEVSQKKSGGEAAFDYKDKQPEVAQRKIQEIVNNSAEMNRYRFFHKIANNGPQTKQIAQLQALKDNATEYPQPVQKKENKTGLPDHLRSGIENLSGYSMDDVKVHYNSGKPAQLNAHAYAQGTDIHIASGQEKHLPHEAWHVVQQKQGRVKPTMQMMDNVNINDDVGLEKAADRMGKEAVQRVAADSERIKDPDPSKTVQRSSVPIQFMIWTYNGASWDPTDWGAVDYGTMPKARDKPAGTTYDDATGAYTYPAAEEKEPVDDTPAGRERAARIQPFLDLMDHLAGENDGSTSKGGHLLLAMQAKWGDDFVLLNPEDRNDNGVWQARWSIKGKEKAGGSTMFPASWTIDELRKQLMASSSIGGKVILQPSDIQIKKAGDTFYPDV